MSDNRHAHVCICPQAGASAATDLRIPSCELGKSDSFRGGDGVAGIASLYKVKLITVADHSRLNGLGSGDTIAGLG